jgi:hypothetical protein
MPCRQREEGRCEANDEPEIRDSLVPGARAALNPSPSSHRELGRLPASLIGTVLGCAEPAPRTSGPARRTHHVRLASSPTPFRPGRSHRHSARRRSTTPATPRFLPGPRARAPRPPRSLRPSPRRRPRARSAHSSGPPATAPRRPPRTDRAERRARETRRARGSPRPRRRTRRTAAPRPSPRARAARLRGTRACLLPDCLRGRPESRRAPRGAMASSRLLLLTLVPPSPRRPDLGAGGAAVPRACAGKGCGQ